MNVKLIQYKYKGNFYSRSDMNTLISLLDEDNIIDMFDCGDFTIRGLGDTFYSKDDADKVIELLVRYRFIENEEVYTRIHNQLDALSGKVSKSNPQKRSRTADDHFESMRYESMFGGRTTFY